MNTQASPNGLILWLLGATGIFLLYCAVKGLTPASVLASFINRGTPPVPFGHSTVTPTTPGTTGNGGGGYGALGPFWGATASPAPSASLTPTPSKTPTAVLA